MREYLNKSKKGGVFGRASLAGTPIFYAKKAFHDTKATTDTATVADDVVGE